jgi:hypothetical protein
MSRSERSAKIVRKPAVDSWRKLGVAAPSPCSVAASGASTVRMPAIIAADQTKVAALTA